MPCLWVKGKLLCVFTNTDSVVGGDAQIGVWKLNIQEKMLSAALSCDSQALFLSSNSIWAT